MNFSIVIPAYNGAKYIERAILSVLSQTRKPDEIIVHDDNSTDSTREICEKYFPEIVYYFNPDGPSGFVNGWNRAISFAKCDFISILHQDDLLYPTFLEEAEQALTTNPDVRHLFTLCDYIDENDLITSNGERYVLKGRSAKKIIRYTGKEYVKAFQKKYNDIFHIHRCPGVITHRSIFDKGCNYNMAAGHIADDDFFFRVGQFTNVIGIMKSLVAYRIHKGSETERIGDVRLVSRLANDYIYQMRQWQNSVFIGKNEIFYFEHYALKFVRRLFSYSIKLNDYALKEKSSKLYSELQTLNFYHWHLTEHLKLELVRFISSCNNINLRLYHTLRDFNKILSSKLNKEIFSLFKTDNTIKEYYQNLLIIAPHPCDEIFGLGGYILQQIEEKAKVHIAYLTDGEDSRVWPDKSEIIRQRIILSEKACDQLGLKQSDITRLHLTDAAVPNPGQSGFVEAVQSIKQLIDALKPEAVFATHTLDYWPYDHVACAHIAREAVKQSSYKPQLWYYWVWAWYNLRTKQLFKLNYKKICRIDIGDQLVRKKELKGLYLNELTPDGKPWCGVLPKSLLNALRQPIEIIEKIEVF